MSRRLHPVTEEEWLKRAHAAAYCVKELATYYGVSPGTLSRHIRSIFGLDARAWLREVRMARARHWLAEGMKVVWTARELGYKSDAGFSHEFSKHHGYPPGEHVLRASSGVLKSNVMDLDKK